MSHAESNVSDWPIDTLVAFRREELLSQGRHDAFLFVLQGKGDESSLRAEIQATEETIANPPEHLKGHMSPNASPRVYKDGYLAGLKDALHILQQANERQPRALTRRVAERPKRAYRANGKAASKKTSKTAKPRKG